MGIEYYRQSTARCRCSLINSLNDQGVHKKENVFSDPTQFMDN